jgi:3-oxoadipate enol-lactonase
MRDTSIELAARREGHGPSFVWAHGLTCSMAVEDAWGLVDWGRIAAAFDVLRYDARGHGRSPATRDPAEYQWSRLAGDLLAVADRQAVARFTAGGQSMGCATSRWAALQAPERVRGLVLATPPTAWEARAGQADMYDRLADFIEQRGTPPMLELLRQRPLFPPWLLRDHPAINDAYLEGVAAMEPLALVTIFRGAKLCQLPRREELRKITQPALILAWPDDPAHPIPVAEELHALLPRSRLVVARSLAEARGWTERILEFLGGLPE